MRIDRSTLTLHPLCAWDELRFQNNVGQLIPALTAILPSFEQAQAVAENCVLIHCATRGQIEGVQTAGDLLYALDLDDLTALAGAYGELDGATEHGINESFPYESVCD